MLKLLSFSQKPLGQVLLATLLFCFIFLALFVGLYKSGTAYIIKEHARRSTNLTAFTGGAVYANGLKLVRVSNGALIILVGADLLKAGLAAAAAVEGGPPAMLAAAYEADKVNARTAFQKFQNIFFGVNNPGIYPLLIEAQALATASENQLSFLPAYAYNYETASAEDVVIPNLALRFRTASELLPEPQKDIYSLMHNGVQHYFSSDEVEPANNPRNPKQMRVKRDSDSDYAGWWVKKEENGVESGQNGNLSKLGSPDVIKALKSFLENFKFDVTDRDDPPCHTFSLLSRMGGPPEVENRGFYQMGEVRLDSNGLAIWDLFNPIDIYAEKVDIMSFPVVRDVVDKLGNEPVVNQILTSSDILNGL
jgi:hypothetical protein